MHTGRLRVLFVDDHALMRKGLIKMVANNPAIEVVGEAARCTSAGASLPISVMPLARTMPSLNRK
ncbi:MAG: hypothetical protein KFF68_12915 [Desulfosarcina sp.]|nr:hypothetical protein [Desulfosarcina sp.]